jgi:AcrR family transcriptional regulator
MSSSRPKLHSSEISGANRSRRGTSQARLLDAVTQVATRDGYARLTVERVLREAGVSRATFYQYFASVDDCFWSAYRRHAEQLEATVAAAARRSEQPQLAMLDALVDLAVSRPDVARVLMREGLAAGRTGLTERDALIARLDHASAGSVAQAATIDLPATILIGSTFGFLAMRLADGSGDDRLREEVREWATAFVRGCSGSSWSSRLAPALPRQPALLPGQSSSTRPRGSAHERILHATAQVVRQKGYRAMTVADIVRVARVSQRTFYNEFPSKADAFMATYEQAFQQGLAACAPAFFISAPWPERIWQGAQAFSGFFAREPSLAHVCLVECYAVGPRFARRVQDTQLAFTLFLEDGYRQRPQAQSLSRACSILTTAAMFEIASAGARRGPIMNLRRLQPLAIYVALAPFIGLDAAGEFVMGKLSQHSDPSEAA